MDYTKLKTLREAQGLSRQELATKMGLSSAASLRILESNTSVWIPPPWFIYNLAHALGVSVTEVKDSGL